MHDEARIPGGGQQHDVDGPVFVQPVIDRERFSGPAGLRDLPLNTLSLVEK